MAKTPIYIDETGRRRRGYDLRKGEDVKGGNPIEALKAQVARLEAEAKRANARLSAFRITGVGVSGVGDQGIMINPAANGNGGGTGPGWTGSIVVCVDDGEGGYTQASANFLNGILISVG